MSRVERPGPSEQFSSLRHGDVVVLECDGPPGKPNLTSIQTSTGVVLSSHDTVILIYDAFKQNDLPCLVNTHNWFLIHA